MDFTIDTGDSADSQQLNETLWVRTLLEGGSAQPQQRRQQSDLLAPALPQPASSPAPPRPPATPASRTTTTTSRARSRSSTTRTAPKGVARRLAQIPGPDGPAQQAFTASGLNVPSYVAFGNHDALVQGNAAANAAFEQVATGCLKPIGPVSNPENVGALLAALFNPANLLASLLTSPQNTIIVPGDPKRQFVSKKQYKDVFKAGTQADGHGFD